MSANMASDEARVREAESASVSADRMAVALARAFAVEPDLLALDEPFVSLDAALAARLRAELIER